jgi:hypothetical protein
MQQMEMQMQMQMQQGADPLGPHAVWPPTNQAVEALGQTAVPMRLADNDLQIILSDTEAV